LGWRLAISRCTTKQIQKTPNLLADLGLTRSWITIIKLTLYTAWQRAARRAAAAAREECAQDDPGDVGRMKRQNTGRHRSVQFRRHAHIPLKQHRVEALSSSSSLRFLHRRLPHDCSSSLLLQCGLTICPSHVPKVLRLSRTPSSIPTKKIVQGNGSLSIEDPR
jgi:hypothetical protein